MPGTIHVSVLNYMDIPSSSPSSPLSLKVSMGKREYQTWDKKEDFSFPLANLRDNIFIMIQDADGNEITRTVIQTREVIEKGSWDDLFALEGGGKVHMKLQFFLSEEEHSRIRRIRESVVKKRHDATTLRASTIGLHLKVERDILAESARPLQNEDGTVEVAILSQPSDPQTYIAKKEEIIFNQQETSPIDTDRSTLETSSLAVSRSSGTQGNIGNATRNVDVANLSQKSDPQTFISKKEETIFNQQENSPNDTDKSTLETSVLAVSKSSGTKRHLGNESSNDDVVNLSQPSSDPQSYIAKKEKMSFHQQETPSNDTDKSTLETPGLAVSKSSGTKRHLGNETSNDDVANLSQPSSDPQSYFAKKEKLSFHQQETPSNDTDKSTLETSVLAVSKSNGTKRNLENSSRSPFSSFKSLSKSRSEGTLISIGRREFEKTPSNVKKMISAFESSQPLVYVKQHLPIAKPTSKLQQQTFVVDAPPEDASAIRGTEEAEPSSMEPDTGQIEAKVSESLPEGKKDQVEVTAVSESMYEKEPSVLMNNQKEGEDAMDNTTSEILFQGISNDEHRPEETFFHCEHNRIEDSGSFVDSWIFANYNRHLCITTANKKFVSMTRECWMQEKPMKRKLRNSIDKKKDKQIPRSSDAECRERLVTQVKRVAMMVAFGALVFLTRERNS